MLDIYVARHGQNEDNANGILNGHRDYPLTEIGRTQARELAEGIKSRGIQFRAVHTSPLSRAHETGCIVADVLGMESPVIMKNLIERDFGIMTGRLATEVHALCSPDIVETDTITYFLSPEGAETFPVLMKRARLVLDELHDLYSDGSILLVGHGDIGKMLYVEYYGLDWMECLRKFHFGNSELLLLSPNASHDEAHVLKIEQHNH